MHLRLMEERRLILSKGKRLSEVAFEVGYESASHFRREWPACMVSHPPWINERRLVAVNNQLKGLAFSPY